MARGLNLREYQESILAKLRDVANTTSKVGTSRLGVVVGGKKALIRLTDISEVLPPPKIHAVPLTANWFLGMANIRGNLYAINDVASMLGWQKSGLSSNSRVLLLENSIIPNTAILVDQLLGLRNVGEMSGLQDFGKDMFCFKEYGYKDTELSEWLEFDARAFTESDLFVKLSLAH